MAAVASAISIIMTRAAINQRRAPIPAAHTSIWPFVIATMADASIASVAPAFSIIMIVILDNHRRKRAPVAPTLIARGGMAIAFFIANTIAASIEASPGPIQAPCRFRWRAMASIQRACSAQVFDSWQ